LLGDNDSSDSDNPEEIHAVNFSDVSAAQNLMGGECDEDSDSGGRLSDRRAAISRASAAGQLNAPGTGDRAQERQQDRITMSTEDAASIRMAMDGFELPAPSWARELDVRSMDYFTSKIACMRLATPRADKQQDGTACTNANIELPTECV
jgi:hypothetical protein